MKIKSLDMVWIVVADLNKAIAYYTDIVGMKLMQRADQFGWAEMSCEKDHCRLGLAQARAGNKAGSNAVVTLTVPEINAARAEMIKKGAKLDGDIIEIPGHVKMQSMSDPDGNQLQLVEVIAKH